MFSRTTFALIVLGAQSALFAALDLKTGPDRIELTVDAHRIVFERNADGEFDLVTFVGGDGQWRELFDARNPIVSGSMFNGKPTAYKVVADSPTHKSVRLTGRQKATGVDFSLTVESVAGTPLVRFTYASKLTRPLELDAPQPTIGLWMSRQPALTVDQGPVSIYGPIGIPWCMGFPAAYAYDGGREAMVFFNLTPSTWFSPKGVCRFLDARVGTHVESGAAAFGLHTFKLSGTQIPAGDMIAEFYVHAGLRAQQPTKLQALDAMVRTFAPLHPTESQIPQDRLTGKPATWTHFAARAIGDLSRPDVMLFRKPAAWDDPPLRLVDPVNSVVRHPGHPGGDDGDFSCVNNHLTPWLLFARMTHDPQSLAIAREKVNALPLYFDPQAGIIRWGTREPKQVGDMEMVWQNMFFNTETLRAGDAVGPADFNPAIAGRFLMGTEGVIELAHNVDYVFPQWFDPYKKEPIIQNDVPKLGKVREPWQGGTYANLMLAAHQLSGDSKYLDEARQSIETLLTRMRYTEANEAYTRTFDDPADFPITELFGNGYGAVAAYKVYQKTGDEKFVQHSRAFLNTLLRLTFWYEDETDPVSRDLRNAGLFYPHGGAHLTCPWETSEAYLAIAWLIQNYRDNDLQPLLVKLTNLCRVNSFYYYPATYTDRVAALDPKRRKDIGMYWPIEPYYGLEATGAGRGPTAAYMSNNAMWNWWMFEALGEAKDRDVMVLNTATLDGYERAIEGVARHLVVYNPSSKPRSTDVVMRSLPDKAYEVTIERAGAKRTLTLPAEKLTATGLPLELAGGEYVYVTLSREDATEVEQRIASVEAAQRALAAAYARLQRDASAAGADNPDGRARFHDAMKQYRAGDYQAAAVTASGLLSAKQN